MKWVFLGVLALAVGLYVVAKVTMPVVKSEGVVTLVWATDENPARKEQLDLFRAWYLKKYGEKIDVRIDPANTQSNKVVVQSVAGTGPDMFDLFARPTLEAYVQSGIILDVTDEAKKHDFYYDKVWESVHPSFVYQGRQYGFPDNAVGSGFFYHKDLFDQAGVPYPKPGWTWNDFLKIAPKLTKKRPDGQKQFALYNADPLSMIYQNGGRIFNENATKCIIDSPKALYALQFYADLREKGYIPSASDIASQASSGGWGTGGTNLFAAKFYAMSLAGRYWLIQYTKDTEAALQRGEKAPYNLGVADIPQFTEQHGFAGARVTGINRNGKQIKYALRFIEFLASEPFNKQINRSFDAMATVKEYCQGPTGIADGPAPLPGLEIANDDTWVRSMRYSKESDYSPFISTNRWRTLWPETLGLMDAGQATPKQVLSTFEKLVNEEIQRNIKRDPDLRMKYNQALKQEGSNE